MSERVKRHHKLARLVYGTGGLMSRVKTPRMTYKWEPDKPFDRALSRAGRVWLPCKTSIRLIRLSVRLDPDHWDHWALDHDECVSGYGCGVCGGHVHPPVDFGKEELVNA